MNGGTIFGREPVLVMGVVQAVVSLAAVLWPTHLDPGTQAAIIALALAITSFIARSQVTPVSTN